MLVAINGEVEDVSGDLCLLYLCSTKGREIEVEVEVEGGCRTEKICGCAWREGRRSEARARQAGKWERHD